MGILFNRHHQHGAIIVAVALVMLFLLGLMGVALNFGHLFIVKSDLQTAMNNCALAAAKELDGQSTALARAASAGQTAGNTSAEITFKDAAYVATTVPAHAAYAQCQPTQSGIGMWLLQSMKAFSGNTVDYKNNHSITALAVAVRVNVQSTCPTPVALKPCATNSLTGGVTGSPGSALVH